MLVPSFGPDDVLPDSATEPFPLPRRHGENSAQGLAVTLMADYNLARRAWLPTGAVVELLAESGLTAAGARTTVSRLTRRGALETFRNGRRAFHRLTGPAATSLRRGGQRIAAAAEEAERWDGRWTLVAFRVPQENDGQRRTLRARLRWLGYAPLYDALWVSPQPLSERAAAILDELSPGAITSFRGDLDERPAGARNPVDAWDLDLIAERYRAFLLRWSARRDQVAAGDVAGGAAVRTRTAVMDDYRQLIVLDPPLPLRALPLDWPRAEARAVFGAVYDGLAGPALAHVRELAARHDGRPRDDIVTHSLADLLAEGPVEVGAPGGLTG